ncbi:copper resistance protein CopC [Mumia sp. ZJ1417]|uniref:copper resistance CopC family protein n=2 Tax=Mumia TaxID=1546255 RepID=UPI001422D5B4|nr:MULTISPECIES: copper resistance CopC family protein [unclassified Mumia]QMW68094.1 copper resistance protein CopC [Mumia sp. ZJ1417]
MTSTAARGLRHVVLACVTAVGLLVLSSPTAVGHAVLVSTTPADGSTVAILPDEIVLTFNERVTTPAYVVAEAPDGTQVASGEARTDGKSVRATTNPADIAGEYRISYRVVSADGHPIDGSVYVTVTEGRTVEKTRAEDDEDTGAGFVHEHRAHFLWGAAGVIAAAALLLWPRRREDKEDA